MRTPEKAVLADTNKSVPVEDVTLGTELIVTAGEKIPLDGEVVKGKAAVDESSVTGEDRPISKKVGSNVFSGTIIQSGFLRVCFHYSLVDHERKLNVRNLNFNFINRIQMEEMALERFFISQFVYIYQRIRSLNLAFS